MKRIWIKLYIGMIDDPHMALLPDWLWRRAIELFLLAGENGDDGLLPPVKGMAWRLRISVEKVTEALQALSKVGVVYETQPGYWYVADFDLLQAPMNSTERVREHRKKKGAETQ